MKALILVGGFGVRLREIIHGRPKHLVLINGQPFLRHLLKLLKKHQIEKVVLAVGYLAQYIIDEFTQDNEGLDISFSEDNRPLGTAGSIKNCEKLFKEDFLIINGDTYLDIDYQQLLADHKKSSAVLTIITTEKQGKPCNAGIYVASPKIFEYIPELVKFSLEQEVIPLLKKQAKINVFQTNQEFIDIGSVHGFNQAIKKLK